MRWRRCWRSGSCRDRTRRCTRTAARLRTPAPGRWWRRPSARHLVGRPMARGGGVAWKDLHVLDDDPPHHSDQEDDAADHRKADADDRIKRNRPQGEEESPEADRERPVAVRKDVDAQLMRPRVEIDGVVDLDRQ